MEDLTIFLVALANNGKSKDFLVALANNGKSK
jgi:hypothetical protein